MDGNNVVWVFGVPFFHALAKRKHEIQRRWVVVFKGEYCHYGEKHKDNPRE
jgi:hypothetical protein